MKLKLRYIIPLAMMAMLCSGCVTGQSNSYAELPQMIKYQSKSKMPSGKFIFGLQLDGTPRTYFVKIGDGGDEFKILESRSHPHPDPNRALLGEKIEQLVIQKGINTFVITQGEPFNFPPPKQKPPK